MTRHARILAHALAALLATTVVAHAQLAQSRFDVDADGWLNVMLPYPSAVPATILNTYTPAWTTGYIWMTDPDGSGSSGDAQYWQAPAKFLGNQLAGYGDSLTFDIANAGSGYGPFHQEDIILVGGGITLVHDLASVPSGAWTHYGVSLSEAAWRRDGLAGPVPTHAEFTAALGAITQLFIRAEYQLGPDTQYLDNVVLAGATAGVESAAQVATLALAPPAPNPSAGPARLDFALPRAGRADVAVFDASGRRVATIAEGGFAPGSHTAAWDGRDAAGRPAHAGIYWVRLAVAGETVARKLVRIE
jgi:hypothetical protein